MKISPSRSLPGVQEQWPGYPVSRSGHTNDRDAVDLYISFASSQDHSALLAGVVRTTTIVARIDDPGCPVPRVDHESVPLQLEIDESDELDDDAALEELDEGTELDDDAALEELDEGTELDDDAALEELDEGTELDDDTGLEELDEMVELDEADALEELAP